MVLNVFPPNVINRILTHIRAVEFFLRFCFFTPKVPYNSMENPAFHIFEVVHLKKSKALGVLRGYLKYDKALQGGSGGFKKFQKELHNL